MRTYRVQSALRRLLLVATIGVCGAGEVLAQADPPPPPPPKVRKRPADGKVVELTAKQEVRISVALSDANGDTLKLDGWPKEITIGTDVPPKSNLLQGRGEFRIPKEAPDFFQSSQVIRNSGEVADMRFEAVVFDSAANEYFLDHVFGTLLDRVGDQEVTVPDLFADTNGDGVLGEGDVLYSVVDMNAYLDGIPSVNLGDTFSIINGRVAGLPGMLFSTSPFVFNPAIGFAPALSAASLFTGLGSTEAVHSISAIPEPATALLVGVGLVGAAAAGRRRRWSRAVDRTLTARTPAATR